jgi:formamidopyrimidine-DNA glycosylase
MPELPEVETIANGVDRRLRGDTIVSASFSSFREPFKTAPDEMAAVLPGLRIERVRRIGKHIVADLATQSGGQPVSKRRSEASARVAPARRSPVARSGQLLIHLGMTGRLLVSTPAEPLAPHTHAVLGLGSGRELRFVDPRRFGRLAFLTTPFTGPGREPLTISPADFASLFRGRKLAIKAALLNQKLLHGVGNIYADESLFRAGIHPARAAGRLTRKRLDRLQAALRAVLREAIRVGGSSVSDYVDADGQRGFFQIQHCVYLRTGQPCLVCKTPIRRMTLAGRGTHYCPRCQR